MGRPKNLIISQRKNISRTATHKDCIQQYVAKTLLEFFNILTTYYSYYIQSDRFMCSYHVGMDRPQATWACKKYCGHCTLLPATVEEARALV